MEGGEPENLRVDTNRKQMPILEVCVTVRKVRVTVKRYV